MTIKINQLTKRYNYQVIFKNIDYTFEDGSTYAVLGPNGSGKSTLLKVLSGFLTPSKGSVNYHKKNTQNTQNTQIENSEVYNQINYAAPYIQLIEDFTLDELLQFHFTFRKLLASINLEEFKNILQLKKVKGKFLNEYSSGMKQRVKLALALLTDSNIVLLDEPLTNLDEAGAKWYNHLVEQYLNNRLLIVASNRLDEYVFCKEQLNILDYK